MRHLGKSDANIRNCYDTIRMGVANVMTDIANKRIGVAIYSIWKGVANVRKVVIYVKNVAVVK